MHDANDRRHPIHNRLLSILPPDEFALEVSETEQEALVSVEAVISYVLANPNAK